MKTLLVAAALMLTFPAASLAGESRFDPGLDRSMVEGRRACTAQGECFTVDPGDEVVGTWGMRRGYPDQLPDYQSTLLELGGERFYGSSRCSSVSDPMRYGYTVPGSCVAVPGTNAIFVVYKRHVYNANAYATLTLVQYVAHDGRLHDWTAPPSASLNPPYQNAADCNPTGTMMHWMVRYDGLDGAGYIARPEAPQGFVDACQMLTAEQAAQRVAQLRAQQEDGNSQVSTQRPSGNAQVSARRCAAVRLGRRAVMVRSIRVRCGAARGIVARFVRRGIEPRGWVCVQARAGRMRTAACKRLGKSKRSRTVKVIARWRA